METFIIFGLTFGMGGFFMGLAAWVQIGKLQRKIEAQRKELDQLSKERERGH